MLDRGCVELLYDKYIMEVVIEAEHHHHHHHDCGLFGYLVRKFKDKGEEGIHCTCIIYLISLYILVFKCLFVNREEFFQLFNWFQLFSCGNCTRSAQVKKWPFWKEVVDGFNYFSLISVNLFSIQDHPCVYIEINKFKLFYWK